MITTDFKYNNQTLSYEVVENGYKIYLGGKLWITQLEPYIPNPEISYEENALAQIEELTKPAEEENDMNTRIASLEETVDFLVMSALSQEV